MTRKGDRELAVGSDSHDIVGMSQSSLKQELFQFIVLSALRKVNDDMFHATLYHGAGQAGSEMILACMPAVLDRLSKLGYRVSGRENGSFDIVLRNPLCKLTTSKGLFTAVSDLPGYDESVTLEIPRAQSK